MFPNTPCWEWPGSRTKAGYGRTFVNGQFRYVHRILYEIMVGPVPDGMELDHLCRNRKCFRTDHLEPVTHQTNCERGNSNHYGDRIAERPLRSRPRTHCKRGHAFDGANRYIGPNGTQRCRQCVAERKRQAVPA